MVVFIEAKDVNKDVRLIDTRFSLQNIQEGRKAYEVGHIEGAIYWDLNDDLSDLNSKNGNHPLPSKEQLKSLFENAGLDVNQPIAIYDGGGEPFATRAFWLLAYAGFKNMAVVNGGFDALIAEGFNVVQEVPHFTPTELHVEWNDEIYADRDYVKSIVDRKVSAVLLDAREEARYLGEKEPLYSIAGHIPTARNYFWMHSKEGNRLRVTEKLEKTVSKDENIVVYCGSGVTASPVYALLKEAGYENVKLYVGSYSDWIQHYDIAKGQE